MVDPVTPYIEAIEGVNTIGSRNPPVRIEIRDMIGDEPNIWELYVLGPQRFQNVDKATHESTDPKEQPLSWFQIANITYLILD